MTVLTDAPSGITYLLWHDLVGVSRTRGVPTRDLPRRMGAGLGWARAGQALNAFGSIVDNPWGPMDEVRQVPDPEALFVLPASHGVPEMRIALCDSRADPDTPWSCCGRGLLRAALADLAAETGLGLCASFEHEFSLLDADEAPEVGFSLAAARQRHALLTELEATLAAMGLGCYTIEPEYGWGQFEVAGLPATGVRAADACLMTRETIREVARRHGLRASFTPKAATDAVGNGAHIHMSLVDRDGVNRAHDPDGPMGLSRVAESFAAGILTHIEALLAFTAPTPVSYHRLGPHHWSTGYRAIGLQNREATLRVTPGVGDAEARARGHNIEFRPCDGAASPYLALAVLVRAGIEGIRAGLRAPPGITVDPAEMTEAERKAQGVALLPATLAQSLAALDADAVAQGWFTDEFLGVYRALKTWEVETAARDGAERTFERYRAAY